MIFFLLYSRIPTDTEFSLKQTPEELRRNAIIYPKEPETTSKKTNKDSKQKSKRTNIPQADISTQINPPFTSNAHELPSHPSILDNSTSQNPRIETPQTSTIHVNPSSHTHKKTRILEHDKREDEKHLDNTSNDSSPLYDHESSRSSAVLSQTSPSEASPLLPQRATTNIFVVPENTTTQSLSPSPRNIPIPLNLSQKPLLKYPLPLSARATPQHTEKIYIIRQLSVKETQAVIDYLSMDKPLDEELLDRYPLLKKMLDCQIEETDFQSTLFNNIDKMTALAPFIRLCFNLHKKETDQIKRDRLSQINATIKKIVLEKAKRQKTEYLTLFIQILEFSPDSLPYQFYRISLAETDKEKNHFIQILKRHIREFIQKLHLEDNAAQEEYRKILTQPYENFSDIQKYLSESHYNKIIKLLHLSLWYSELPSITRKNPNGSFSQLERCTEAQSYINLFHEEHSNLPITVFDCTTLLLPENTQPTSLHTCTTLNKQLFQDGILNSDEHLYVDIPPNGFVYAQDVKFNTPTSSSFDIILTSTPDDLNNETFQNNILKVFKIAIAHNVKTLIIFIDTHHPSRQQALELSDIQKQHIVNAAKIYGKYFNHIVFADNLIAPKR